MLWTGGGSAFRQLLTFVANLVLARLLTPTDFGLAALVVTITTFASIYTNLGIGPAVVRAERLTGSLITSALLINVVSGLALTLTLLAAAEPLARLFEAPALAPLLVLASAVFTLSVSVVPRALLERALLFRRVAVVEVLTTAAGMAVAIAAARAGYGARSLVFSALTITSLSSLTLWWRPPGLSFARPSRRDLRDLWQFSWGLVGFTSVNYWARNLDNLLIGKVAGPLELGLYSRAYNLMLLPVSQVATSLARVLLPMLASARDDLPLMRRRWLRTAAASWTVGLPLGLGTAVCAPSIVLVLYGDQWAAAAPLLSVLALSTGPQLIARTLGTVFEATGRTAQQFRLGLLTTAIGVVALVAALPAGTLGITTAVSCSLTLTTFVHTRAVLRILEATWSDLWGVLRPGAAACVPLLVGALAPLALDSANPMQTWLLLVLQVGFGGTLYVIYLLCFERSTVRQLRGMAPKEEEPSQVGVRHSAASIADPSSNDLEDRCAKEER